MYPKPVQKLIDQFSKLPGIGPRQASRFVFFMLKQNGSFLDDFVSSLNALREKVVFCEQCFRSMEKSDSGHCGLCLDKKRDPKIIAVVEKESDMRNLEKTRQFTGLYHVLNGGISPLDQESPQKVHLQELCERVKKTMESQKTCEVILATNPTTEGDTTALYIERTLLPLKEQTNLRVSRLGRGLSLGSELEYADEITLKNALNNRK